MAPERIDTIISFQKAAEVGAKTEASAEVLLKTMSVAHSLW